MGIDVTVLACIMAGVSMAYHIAGDMAQRLKSSLCEHEDSSWERFLMSPSGLARMCIHIHTHVCPYICPTHTHANEKERKKEKPAFIKLFIISHYKIGTLRL